MITVALYEFFRIVRSKTFLIGLLVIPLVLIVPGLFVVAMSVLDAGKGGTVDENRIVLLDESGLVTDRGPVSATPPSWIDAMPWHTLGGRGPSPIKPRARRLRLMHVPTMKEAQRLLQSNQIDQFVVIPRNYVEAGKVRVYFGKHPAALDGELNNLLHDLLVEQLGAASGLTRDRLMRLVKGPRIQTYRIDDSGKIKPFSPISQVLKLFVPLILTGIVFLSVSGCYDAIALAVTREKRSKLIEILLASTTAEALLFGKVLGVLAAACVKLVVWLGLLAVLPGLMAVFLQEQLDYKLQILPFLFSLPFALGGILLFSLLYAGLAFLIDREQGAKFPIVIMALVSGLPFFCFMQFMLDPHAVLPRMFSLIPLFSPIGMPARLAFASEVPVVDMLLSFLLLVLTIYLAVKSGARLFRFAVAHQGESLGVFALLRVR